MWAAWRPDANRLNAWEQLTPEQRQELADILALEGPDILGGQNTTLREALVPQGDPLSGFSVCYGQVLLKLNSGSVEEAHTALDRLVNAICCACLNSLIAVPLFVHLCLHKPVDSNVLTILEYAYTIEDHSLCGAVLDLLTGEAISVQMGGILDLFAILNPTHAHPLRHVLRASIGEVSDSIVSKLQGRFYQELQRQRNVRGSGTTLHNFMKGLQAAVWIRSSLSERTRLLLQQWPNDKDMEYLFMIRAEAINCNQPSLTELIDKYCVTYLAGAGDVDEVTKNMVDGLITIWKQPLHRERREVAVAIAECSILDAVAKRQCLALLATARTQFVHEIRPILQKGDIDEACTEFVRVLKIPNLLDTEETHCWRGLLLGMIIQRKPTLLWYTFKKYPTLDSWLQWMVNIREIFEDLMEDPTELPPVLRPSLHSWISRLRNGYLPVLLDLEKQCMFQSAMPFILTKWEISDAITRLLDLIVPPTIEPHRSGIQAIITRVNLNNENFEETLEALSLFLRMAAPGARILADILQGNENSNKELSEALLNVWLRDHPDQLDPFDESALEAIARLLKFQIPAQVSPSQAAMQDFSAHLNNETKKLMGDAVSLERIRLTLKEHDPRETSLLLQRLGIRDAPTLSLGDTASIVPHSLVDVVEEISKGIFEIFFPLNHIKHLQRKALGIGKARMLLVRVVLKDNNFLTPGFCVHLYPEGDGGHISNTSTPKHRYFQVKHQGAIPDRQNCHGQDSRIVYQLNRTLWRHLMAGSTTLERTHDVLTAVIDNLTTLCIVCGRGLGARLWRSTTCGDTCGLELRKSGMEVRLADIRHDPDVVDLLLNAALSAAVVDDMELLPGCPSQTTASVIRILTNSPALSSLQHAGDLAGAIGAVDVSDLLSWICNGYCGFMSSATDALKIPSMPGVHQFVLANANPKIEKAFAVHLSPSATTRVVFHGTSIDRLYRILLYGLQSDMKRWQRHGAAYGQGIYLADEPKTALDYAKQSHSTWPASRLPACKVVLGCELFGTNAPIAQGIHLASDPSTIMVRYVFLFPYGVSAPLARHVEPAMASVFASLRNRSI
jgi:hypothetical protein